VVTDPSAPSEQIGAVHPWIRRNGWLVVALALVGVGVAYGLKWAEEPRSRRSVLFEAPIRVEPGTVVRGGFLPEHTWYRIEVRFPVEASLEDLGAEIGGGWGLRRPDPDPARLRASYTLRDGGSDPREGVSGERFDGTFSRTHSSVTLASIQDARLVTTELELRIDQAPPGLASREAHLVVRAAGDWINYAWLEADMKRAIVLLAALLGSALIVGVWWLLRRRWARRAPGS
jgi:hypothetical protein